MKSLFKIIAVILIVILALGAVSSLSDSVGSVGDSSGNTSDLPSGKPVDEAPELLNDHGHYFSDDDCLNVQSGVLSSQATDTTAIGFVLQNLTPGKTYFFTYSIEQLFVQNGRLESYYLRTGGPKDSTWDEVPVGEFDLDTNTLYGAYQFTAETTSAEFFLRKMPYVSDSDSVSLMASSMKQYVKEIKISEVIEE